MAHPIRDAELHVFARLEDNGNGPKFVARFHPYDNWPVFFKGDTLDEVEAKADAFRTECIEKYEAEVIARQKRVEAAKKARKEKAND